MSTSSPLPKIPPVLTDIEYYILITILTIPRHGIGIFEDVARFTENQLVLSPGTLYAALKRMFATGWIMMVAPSEAGYEPDERRKFYRATDEGARVVEEKAAWFELEAARARAELRRRSDSGSPGSSGGATLSSDRSHSGDSGKSTPQSSAGTSENNPPFSQFATTT
jgi:DNA-binding PadR family transcriptional regulator